ncbi:hypothetical protein NQ318_000771 [Aromia moschata]|uniref:Uncharacterized protein n=1 Tax=Aromia moschata TaxID=1265417 RepID=A0AAV8YV43_9CUCU|nr:hypothetical protein NQ318_000771 [Aromia moschata]
MYDINRVVTFYVEFLAPALIILGLFFINAAALFFILRARKKGSPKTFSISCTAFWHAFSTFSSSSSRSSAKNGIVSGNSDSFKIRTVKAWIICPSTVLASSKEEFPSDLNFKALRKKLVSSGSNHTNNENDNDNNPTFSHVFVFKELKFDIIKELRYREVY